MNKARLYAAQSRPTPLSCQLDFAFIPSVIVIRLLRCTRIFQCVTRKRSNCGSMTCYRHVATVEYHVSCSILKLKCRTYLSVPEKSDGMARGSLRSGQGSSASQTIRCGARRSVQNGQNKTGRQLPGLLDRLGVIDYLVPTLGPAEIAVGNPAPCEWGACVRSSGCGTKCISKP